MYVKYLLLIVIGALALTSCSSNNSGNQDGSATLNQEKLRHLLKRVDNWPGSNTNYSRENWVKLVAISRNIQALPPEVVEATLSKYQLSDCSNGDFQNFDHNQLMDDGKLFLLMRVTFDLPESMPSDRNGQVVVFGNWTARWLTPNGISNADGTLNMAWPIRWCEGHPELVSGYLGFSGINSRYNASNEYQFFHERYAFRDLSNFRN